MRPAGSARRLALLGLALGASPAPAAVPLGAARFDWFHYEGLDPVDAVRRPGANQYRNPILSGFYPDPSITRVGLDYYLVSSTFAYFPGIPVFHSRDLVSWTQIGNAVDRPGQLDFGGLGLSRGVFAPTIEHHDGIFYILNTCVDCGGNFVIIAHNPAGPWSNPVWLPDLEGGIDPGLFFDDDGKAWIVNNGPPESTPRYDGHRAIWIQEFDVRTLRTIGPRRVLVDGGVDPSTNPIWIEGPHILKVAGYYYLICAEGGTAAGHSQVVLRSRAPTGPYIPYPGNPILTQRDLPPDRPHPITSAGHADFVQTPNGEWWATFLAVRPYTSTFYNTGRETFLLPVRWVDGWPRMTGPGETIPYVRARPNLPRLRAPAIPTTGPFALRETFDGARLGPHWMMVRNPSERWHGLSGGELILAARPVGLGDMGNPSFLARRQQHIAASVSTVVRFDPSRDGDEAGIAAFQSDDYWYSLSVAVVGGRRVVRLARRAGPSEPPRGVTMATAPLPGTSDSPVQLGITTDSLTYRFSYAPPGGQWRPLGEPMDGNILSTRIAGGFVGAVFGLYAASAPR
jgi:xylan 1,4-beta-xylosidase